MRFQRWIGIAALALVASGARADRLIWIPTAETARPQIEYMHSGDDSRQVITGQVGILNRFELLARHYVNFERSDHTEIGGQFSILPEGIATPGLAVGVWDVADQGPRGRRFFGVASYKVPLVDKVPLGIHDIKVHAGIGSNSLSGVFLGGQVGFPLGLRLYAEYDARDFNAGLSWNPLRFLRFKAESWDGDFFGGVQLSSPL